MRSLHVRLVPVVLLGSLSVSYVLTRPALLARDPHLAIAEFPAGALIVGLLVWAALARRRARAAPEPWRRHEQVVRPLPDPALAADVDALERWVETGDAPEEAAGVLARAASRDPREQERLRGELAPTLAITRSRRKRESILKERSKTGA